MGQKMIEINSSALLACAQRLSECMGLAPLPEPNARLLLDHLLGDAEYLNQPGRSLLECFQLDLITEQELRDVLMAHFATKIAHHNQVSEPGFDKHDSSELTALWDSVLFGRPAKVLAPSALK